MPLPLSYFFNCFAIGKVITYIYGNLDEAEELTKLYNNDSSVRVFTITGVYQVVTHFEHYPEE